LEFLYSSDLLASDSQVAGTIGTYCRAWVLFYVLEEFMHNWF
jgi:hypothetical protein